MNYPVLKVSVLTQAASLALHAVVIAGGGWLFFHPAQFGMDRGQGGAVGLASRSVLQAEVQLNDARTLTTNEAKKADLQNELSPVPDPDGETVATPSRSLPAEINSRPVAPPLSAVAKYNPTQETASIGSPGTLTAKSPASGNGGAKIAAEQIYLHNPPPAYPTVAREKGWQGRVMLRVTVSVAGTVSDIKLLKSSGYQSLDDAAQKAVRKWQFQPATDYGEKVEDTVDLPFVFSLTK